MVPLEPLRIEILPQPDDVTCGPTSLHAVYRRYGLNLPLKKLIQEIEFLEDGGTLAVFLGIDALKRGFRSRLYSYNLRVFDPTWINLDRADLIDRLRRQLSFKSDKKLGEASRAYIRFLEMGGEILFRDLSTQLLQGYFRAGVPVLAGLSATYLYSSKREYTNDQNQSVFDDLAGEPAGHFVVLYGIDKEHRILVADPDRSTPLGNSHYYQVESRRLVHSILLGILTYDANLLVITPRAPSGALES
ncbi:MAG TPA: peptidase-C39 like family protein [Fibrobacteraceae bacterium]|nr:peptidase-C39 like family protein [Fibrobacteraceae bacterium]